MNAKIRRTIEQTALHEGALRIEWADGQNHYLVRFYMPSGLVVSMPVSKGSRIDEYKYKG